MTAHGQNDVNMLNSEPRCTIRPIQRTHAHNTQTQKHCTCRSKWSKGQHFFLPHSDLQYSAAKAQTQATLCKKAARRLCDFFMWKDAAPLQTIVLSGRMLPHSNKAMQFLFGRIIQFLTQTNYADPVTGLLGARWQSVQPGSVTAAVLRTGLKNSQEKCT